MAKKPREVWQVPLFWLRDRGRIESVGVHCNGCGHKRFWPIGEMMQEQRGASVSADAAAAMAARWATRRPRVYRPQSDRLLEPPAPNRALVGHAPQPIAIRH